MKSEDGRVAEDEEIDENMRAHGDPASPPRHDGDYIVETYPTEIDHSDVKHQSFTQISQSQFNNMVHMGSDSKTKAEARDFDVSDSGNAIPTNLNHAAAQG